MTIRQTAHYIEVAEAGTGNLQVTRQYVDILYTETPNTSPPSLGSAAGTQVLWKVNPFQFWSRPIAGQTGDRTYVQSEIGFSDVATGIVIRPLSVSSSLGVSDDVYGGHPIAASASSTLSFTDLNAREVPEDVADDLALVDLATVAGGKSGSLENYGPHNATLNTTGEPGYAIYLQADASVTPAQADAIATADVIGLITRIEGTVATYVTDGFLTLADWTDVIGTTDLTPGMAYYLSATNEPQLSTTPATTIGHVVVLVGRALSTKTLDIEISEGVLL